MIRTTVLILASLLLLPTIANAQTWVDVVQDMATEGPGFSAFGTNGAQKDSAISWAGVFSDVKIGPGESCRWTIADISSRLVLGLNQLNTDGANWNNSEYSFVTAQSGAGDLQVLEGTSFTNQTPPIVVGDTLEVGYVAGGSIEYYHTTSSVRTLLKTTTGATGTFYCQGKIRDNGRSYDKFQMRTLPAAGNAVTWTNGVGVSISGNSHTRTAAGSGWGTAGAFSVESFAGNGFCEWTVTSTAVHQMGGMSITDPDVNFASILFAPYNQTGNYLVYESGTLKFTSAGALLVGDQVRTTRTGTAITYDRIRSATTTLMYTSAVASTGVLHCDTAVHTNGAVIFNASIGGQAAGPEAQDTAPLDSIADDLTTFGSVPSVTAAQVGLESASFSGAVGDYLTVADSAELRPAEFLRCDWVLADEISATRTPMVVTKGIDGGARVYEEFIRATGVPHVNVWNTSSAPVTAFGPSAITAGQWSHVCVGYFNGNVVSFVDGVAGTPIPLSGTLLQTSSSVIFGQHNALASLFSLKGQMDSAKTWDVAGLTDQQVTDRVVRDRAFGFGVGCEVAPGGSSLTACWDYETTPDAAVPVWRNSAGENAGIVSSVNLGQIVTLTFGPVNTDTCTGGTCREDDRTGVNLLLVINEATGSTIDVTDPLTWEVAELIDDPTGTVKTFQWVAPLSSGDYKAVAVMRDAAGRTSAATPEFAFTSGADLAPPAARTECLRAMPDVFQSDDSTLHLRWCESDDDFTVDGTEKYDVLVFDAQPTSWTAPTPVYTLTPAANTEVDLCNSDEVKSCSLSLTLFKPTQATLWVAVRSIDAVAKFTAFGLGVVREFHTTARSHISGGTVVTPKENNTNTFVPATEAARTLLFHDLTLSEVGEPDQMSVWFDRPPGGTAANPSRIKFKLFRDVAGTVQYVGETSVFTLATGGSSGRYDFATTGTWTMNAGRTPAIGDLIAVTVLQGDASDANFGVAGDITGGNSYVLSSDVITDIALTGWPPYAHTNFVAAYVGDSAWLGDKDVLLYNQGDALTHSAPAWFTSVSGALVRNHRWVNARSVREPLLAEKVLTITSGTAAKTFTAPSEMYWFYVDAWAHGTVGASEIALRTTGGVVVASMSFDNGTLTVDTDSAAPVASTYTVAAGTRYLMRVDPAAGMVRFMAQLQTTTSLGPVWLPVIADLPYTGAVGQVAFTGNASGLDFNNLVVARNIWSALGDSIAAGIGFWAQNPESEFRTAEIGAVALGDPWVGNSFPIRFGVASPKWRHIENVGIGSNTGDGMLTRIDDDVFNHAPIGVILGSGTNDLWHVADTLPVAQQRTCDLLHHLRLRVPYGAAMKTEVWPGSLWFTTADKANVDGFNAWIGGAAGRWDTRFIPTWDETLDPGVAYGLLPAYWSSDGAHPNGDGHGATAVGYAAAAALNTGGALCQPNTPFSKRVNRRLRR